jgi:hypothetical protein
MSHEWVMLLSGAVIGAVISIVLAVTWDRLVAGVQRRKGLWKARRVARAVGRGPIHVAGRSTAVHMVEGDGRLILDRAHVIVNLRSSMTDLPPLVEARREQVGMELARRDSSGPVKPWDSPDLVALNAYRISRTAHGEHAVLELDCSTTDYATFAATVLSLDEEVIQVGDQDGESTGSAHTTTTLRSEYLQGDLVEKAVDHPIPFLANGLGVALLCFTGDGQVILTRRRTEARARPGGYDVSVVEGFNCAYDADGTSRLSVFRTCVRGAEEELGLAVDASDITLLGFVVDMDFYQWNIVGTLDTRLTASEVLAAQRLHAKDRWEGRVVSVPAEPAAVFRRLRDEEAWDTALVTAYLAFCHKQGIEVTHAAAQRIFPHGQAKRSAPRARAASKASR